MGGADSGRPTCLALLLHRTSICACAPFLFCLRKPTTACARVVSATCTCALLENPIPTGTTTTSHVPPAPARLSPPIQVCGIIEPGFVWWRSGPAVRTPRHHLAQAERSPPRWGNVPVPHHSTEVELHLPAAGAVAGKNRRTRRVAGVVGGARRDSLIAHLALPCAYLAMA